MAAARGNLAMELLLVALALVALAAVAVLLSIARKGAAKPAAAGQLPPKGRASLAEDPAKPCIRILFGTQTGTAERFSKQLGNELRSKFGESTTIDVRDVETYKTERLDKEKLVVMCMATYGDGEPTDNAAVFYSWLCKEADAVEAGSKEPFLKVGLFSSQTGHAAGHAGCVPRSQPPAPASASDQQDLCSGICIAR